MRAGVRAPFEEVPGRVPPAAGRCGRRRDRLLWRHRREQLADPQDGASEPRCALQRHVVDMQIPRQHDAQACARCCFISPVDASITHGTADSHAQRWGIAIDEDTNDEAVGLDADISAEGSRVKVLVLKTDEELAIAQQTLEVVGA